MARVVTLAGSLAGALEASRTLQFTTVDIGITGSAYLTGAVLGAIFFGWRRSGEDRPRRVHARSISGHSAAWVCA
jgi:hypothetical protein